LIALRDSHAGDVDGNLVLTGRNRHGDIWALLSATELGAGEPSATELVIRFRVADNHHDVDMSSVYVTEDGDTVTLDGTGSVIPNGWQAWFGALVQGSGEPMTLAYSTSSLQGGFTASAAVDSYVVRLVLAEPGQMPDDSNPNPDISRPQPGLRPTQHR
jgi:hypothetical protein